MTSRDFCFWLQGFLEIGQPTALSPDQLEMIRRHLALVFKHEIDPSMGDPEHQAKLDEAHHHPRPHLSFRPHDGDLVMRC